MISTCRIALDRYSCRLSQGRATLARLKSRHHFLRNLGKNNIPKSSIVTASHLTSSFSVRSMVDLTNVCGPHGAYAEEYAWSIQDPQSFWMDKAQLIPWFTSPTKALEIDPDNGLLCKWFPDGITNTCYNCLDFHVESGRGDQVAVYYDSPVTGTKQQFTYSELLDHVARFAGSLTALGIKTGDRVVIYMPMIPEAVIAMLACARIGAVHSVVFGGFAAKELATRIDDCQPKLIVSASVGVEPTRLVQYKPLLDNALEMARHEVQHSIVVQRPVQKCELGPKDLDYETLMASSSAVSAVPLPANHMHYILYTSGTTGFPKGVVRDTAGWAVALKYSMSAFYNTNPGEVYWAASDIGWVVGHGYCVYGPLLQGCSTILYEGKPVGTPDAGAFWRVIEEYKVKTFFVAPTAFRAIKQADPGAELAQIYDLSSLKALFLAGEHCDPDTLHYCEHALDKYGDAKYAIDHWWQTELGHPGAGNALGLGRMPIRFGACAAPAPGFDINILDEDGNEVPPGELGDMVIRTPLPPGTLRTLYKNDDRYISDYLSKYPGYYDTGDAAFRDEQGYVHIMGRTDDVINTAGHRLSTGTLEEILQAHHEVADCAVIPVKDSIKGHVPVGFVITNKGSTIDPEILKSELIESVRHELGPVASFKKVAIVDALPKTRSGKILRGTMAKIANGQSYTVTPTIEDPTVFDKLAPIIRAIVDGEE